MKTLKTTLLAALMTVLSLSAMAGKPYGRSYSSGGLDQGYRGFVAIGWTFGVGDLGIDRLSLNTTHGYQLNEHFFVGGGAGLNFWHLYKGSMKNILSLPLYADARADFNIAGDLGFFGDLKIGYALLDMDGFYFYPNIGLRYGINDILGVNLGFGYEMILNKNSWGSSIAHGLALKLGMDF